MIDAKRNYPVRAFVEKVPVVTDEALDAESDFPQEGVIACEILRRSGGTVHVHTDHPWGVAFDDGETEFVVPEGLMIEIPS